VNREERLRRELPAELKERAAELAHLPAATVDLIVAGLRLSRRAGREHEQELRRLRRGRPRDADEIADGAGRLLGRMGRRGADGDLDAAAALYDLIERRGPALLRLSVAGLRARSYTDAEIAAGLGVTRQAVWQRFARKGAFAQNGADPPGGSPSVGRQVSEPQEAAEPGAAGLP
jgi:hypothetical protein